MTRIAIGADHAGYVLKEHLVGMLIVAGYEVDDQGTFSTESVDYPAICAGVGRTVRDGKADFGIVLGGSGQGEQLAANKIRGVRAALCNDLYTARMARQH
ncbi:MAG TPA: RpiB/LacA/LacB family sugar-phosphate isomerase, partial [Ilumatobacteraceae bacterium]|nr:RpiB/LacA/LacB family sugar-phosphate isomerase [Ilumatobacteraceae bacterium]